MAYSYVTGAYSAGWYPSGSDVQRKIAARMYYQFTETATTFRVDYYLQMTLYKDNAGYTFYGRLYNNGSQIATGSRTTTYNKNGTNHTGVYYTIISTQNFTINKTQSAQSRTISGKVYRSGYEGTYYSNVSVSYTIPALVGYNVTYDANGGEGAPDNQFKVETVDLTLSSVEPTRIGYTFSGWSTSSSGSAVYQPGDTYSTEEELHLYAVWTPNTYTITYNANNASATGTTATSTHTYDVAKALTTNGYSLTNYLFAGWATSSTGAVVYTNGQSVTNLATSGNVDLYAVWKYQYEPAEIQNVTAIRWNYSENVADDAGDAGKISVTIIPAYRYSTLTSKSYVSTQVTLDYRITGSGSSYTQIGNSISRDYPTTITWTTGSNVFDPAQQYDIRVRAVGGVASNTTTGTTFISVAEFIIDFDELGNSVGVFHTADGVTTDGEKALRLEGDLVLYLDDSAGSGTDYDILHTLDSLGWNLAVDAD